MKMNLERYLNSLRSLIDKSLDAILPSGKKEPRIIHKAMRYTVLAGGKRIRPILVMEASRACGGRLKDAVMIGCAVELVHAYSLIHDDLPSMDNDDYRRGKPSCHKVFGEANAILAGDALLTLAFNIISKNLKAPDIGIKAVRELSDAIGAAGMVGGQAMDIKFSTKRLKGVRILNFINRLKTAKLFEASSKLGAISARAGKKDLAAMAGYGAALGMAFQIVDDIIDGEGYAELFGIKKARSDAERLIAKSKNTLSDFAEKADRLREIADYVLERTDGEVNR